MKEYEQIGKVLDYLPQTVMSYSLKGDSTLISFMKNNI
jgi:hypothetical protein